MLGLIASFNKGVSRGGFDTVVTGGQMIAGVKGKTTSVLLHLLKV